MAVKVTNEQKFLGICIEVLPVDAITQFSTAGCRPLRFSSGLLNKTTAVVDGIVYNLQGCQ